MRKQKNEIFNVTKQETNKVKGIKNTIQALKQVKPNKGLLAIIILLYTVLTAISVTGALIARELLFIVTASAWKRLIKFAIIYFLLGVIQTLLGSLLSYCSTKYNSYMVTKLKTRAFYRVTTLSASCFANNNTSTYVGRINESESIASNSMHLLSYTQRIITDLAYSIVFAITVPILFVIILTFYVLEAVLFHYLIPKYVALRKNNRKNFDDANNIMIESIRGALDMKGLNIYSSYTNRFEEGYTKAEKNGISISAWWQRRMAPLIITTNNLSMFVFMICAAIFGATGSITAATLLFAWTYKTHVHTLFQNFHSIRDSLSSIETSASRYLELFDDEQFTTEKFGNKTIDVTGNIEFKNVTFSYNKNKPVLKDINFTIEANKVTAFVGKTGCGKSSTLSLISRFYDAKKGTIKIDGTNIKSLTQECLRSNIAYIQQAPYIFNATFKENLRFVKPNATDDEIIEACKKSEIHDFIETCDNGYDTLIGENGINLSGGQKQRLAIARAFLNNSKIILFDESTSSLDNHNQAKIQKTINTLKKDHTIVVVAHRLSTIINADKIIFIQDNHILAEGTHTELIQNCTEYRDLYKIESKKKT